MGNTTCAFLKNSVSEGMLLWLIVVVYLFNQVYVTVYREVAFINAQL